ncbi:MAG: U32 family peptidase [Bacilli bacterium]|nr:U32 family peptidase [Bacilli bacterium]
MKNELLAPAGSLEAVKVAINYGADAVYCAGKRFGARSFIANLSDEEIVEAAEYVHLHSKRIYITLNTLIFEEEFEEVKNYIDFLYKHVDALIVQDYGVIHYVRTHYPDFPIHISTQCSIHNIEDVRFLKKLGVDRVVLAREVPLEDIRKIKEAGIDLEIFIHGALCFSFSGMCYLSYFHGGRSGNRGSCAQPCRQNYTLLEDGEPIDKGALLSMKDLNTIEQIKPLLELGIASLKIEGRAKSLEYLAAVVKIYRQIIDQFNAHEKIKVDQELLDDLYVSYSREKTKGYLFGENNKDITTDSSVKHQGVLVGKVIGYNDTQVKIKLYKELELLDGIRIISRGKEYGTTVTRIIENGQMVKVGQKQVFIDISDRINVGSPVYKTSSAKIKRELKSYYNPKKAKASLEVTIEGFRQTLSLKVNNIKIVHSHYEKLEKALTVKDDVLMKQFAKTNNLPIEYEKVLLHNDGGWYLPISKINEMRSSLLDELLEKLENQVERINNPYPYKDEESLYVKDKSVEEISLDREHIYSDLVDYKPLKEKEYAFHLKEIGENSIISPYFGVTNLEAVKFFRNITKGVIILSYESTLENAIKLAEFDKNLGFMVEYYPPLMVSKHCPVAKHYGVPNKGCGKCLEHHYQLVDREEIHDLHFKNCYMFIEGEKAFTDGDESLVSVKII